MGKGRTESRRARQERRRREREAADLAKGIVANDKGPNIRVLELRALFEGLARPTNVAGEATTVDQEIHDALGQMFVLGLLDGTAHDSQELRDRGREWGRGYARRLKGLGMKTATYERRDRSTPNTRYTAEDEAWDRLDASLTGFERGTLLSLICDPLIGDCEPLVPWAKSLIHERLLAKGRIPPAMIFPTEHDRALLKAAVRGLVMLAEAGTERNKIAA